MKVKKDNISMLRLGLDEDELFRYQNNKAEINRKMGILHKEARKRAKRTTCYICNKACDSFCNSHSVPQFCLRRIAKDGKVFHSGVQKFIPFLGEDDGVNSAGTFRLICQECDNRLFQDYENPLAYSKQPSGRILAEIAMKNYLQMISKRLEETELYSLMSTRIPYHSYSFEQQLKVNDLDLVEYNLGFKRAKTAALGKHDDWYYLCYYQHLDYVVPYAFQGQITLISDLKDNVINDIYNMSPEYHTKDINIAVFPLQDTSVIIMFIDNHEKRYRSFYRQLNKLPLAEQLSTINYIIFSYSENVFISKAVNETVLKNKHFLDTCQKTIIAQAELPYGDALEAAIKDFSLSKRNEIPNLLSPEFALETNTKREKAGG